MTILTRHFFAQPTLTVARQLLGQQLVRQIKGQHLRGIIVETEAYIGLTDSACHASKGRTARTEVMFGPPGYSYIYLIYGMYHMLNVVTETEGVPAAVLIRAIEPVAGLEQMRVYRYPKQTKPKSPRNLTNGPGKICQALGLDRTFNQWDVTTGHTLWLEAGTSPSEATVVSGPRIGIDYAQPEDRAAPWRFWLRDNLFVSRR